MKYIVFSVALVLPLIALGATSTNYQLDQEGTGFVEFDTSSTNYQSKAIIGDAASEVSTSANFIIDQRRIWAVTVTPSPTPPPSIATSGGGGAGTAVAQTGGTFSGRAYPLSSVRLVKDGQLIATTITGPDGSFSITALGINSGSHIFVIVGVDGDGLVSQSQSFSITVSSGVTTLISGIFLAPTLAVDKNTVKQGDNLAIFGQTVPESIVTIGVASEHETFRTTSADADGVFLYNLDTVFLVKGGHETRAKSAKDGAISGFGRTVAFVVGDINIFRENQACVKRGDMNNDCRVNLVDFSIAAFWYKKELNDTMRLRELAQLNGDGVINLVDLSIMAYYWTG